MKKIFLILCGLGFVFLAGLGVLIPGLPTTIFLILAAACFAKSSPKLYKLLLDNKVFGPMIKNWQETRTIPKKAKRLALGSLFIVSVISAIILPNLLLKVILLLVMIIPIVILFRLKETEDIGLVK